MARIGRGGEQPGYIARTVRHQVLPWRARVSTLFIILGGMVGTVLLPATAAGADPIAAKRNEAKALAQRIDQLDTRVEQLAEKYNAARLTLDSVQADVTKAQAGVTEATQQMAQKRTALRDIAIEAYVEGSDPGTPLDLSSGATD